MSGASIELRGLSKSFGDVAVLDSVDLAAGPGEVVAVIGPSGCGKSTLLHVLAGLEEPSVGTVLVDGERPHTLLGTCAFMPQRDSLLPWRRVLDNATLGLELRGVGRREARERAAPLLVRFGLAGFERSWPWQLSGGMRQRVAFLRTVLQERRALLLDEPFGALDAITRLDLQEWLAGVLAGVPATVVLVTHDVAEAALLADRVVVLAPRPGRVVETLAIDLPRPRSVESPAFAAVEARLRTALRQAAAPPG
jgi:ABC-type nitrate/sulfonate/bicarbonate transport system ATPase subunit